MSRPYRLTGADTGADVEASGYAVAVARHHGGPLTTARPADLTRARRFVTPRGVPRPPQCASRKNAGPTSGPVELTGPGGLVLADLDHTGLVLIRDAL